MDCSVLRPGLWLTALSHRAPPAAELQVDGSHGADEGLSVEILLVRGRDSSVPYLREECQWKTGAPPQSRDPPCAEPGLGCTGADSVIHHRGGRCGAAWPVSSSRFARCVPAHLVVVQCFVALAGAWLWRTGLWPHAVRIERRTDSCDAGRSLEVSRRRDRAARRRGRDAALRRLGTCGSDGA